MEPTDAYAAWIQKIPLEETRGKCAERTLEMLQEFPELKRVRGYVWLMGCPEPRSHWWLVSPDGEIVDPTARQFSDPGYIYAGCVLMSYEEIDEETFQEPKGKCMNCGALSYYDTYACSRACERELELAFR